MGACVEAREVDIDVCIQLYLVHLYFHCNFKKENYHLWGTNTGPNWKSTVENRRSTRDCTPPF